MDIRFILRNAAGFVLARAFDQVPSALRWLPASKSSLKPFIAARLQSDRYSQVVTKDFGGFRMSLHLNDYLQRMIYLGIYENEDIAFCRALVGEGGTCIDVGANVGWYTLHFGSWVGQSGRVIAFEADRDVANKLRINCELSGMVDRVELLNCAVSNIEGVLQFVRATANTTGWGSVLQQRLPTPGQVVDVPSTTLDSILEARGITEVDLIKIDVESHEFEVLEGSQEALRRKVFRNVLIEWEGLGHTRNGKTIADMARIFEDAGYTPSLHTARFIAQAQREFTDPRQLFANLLYHRGHG